MDSSGSPKRYLIGKDGTPGQGQFMLFVLHIVGDTIVDANYKTYPCPVADKCGQFVCEWASGKRIADLTGMTADRIEESVGHMPLGREHCPFLAEKALRDAIAQNDIELAPLEPASSSTIHL